MSKINDYLLIKQDSTTRTEVRLDIYQHLYSYVYNVYKLALLLYVCIAEIKASDAVQSKYSDNYRFGMK